MTKLPAGWSESRVREQLAANRRELIEERSALVQSVKTATSRIAEIDRQLEAIEESVGLLNE